MRECPSYITQAVKKVDAALSIVWNNTAHQWALMDSGKFCFFLSHYDDSPIIDLSESELMDILRRTGLLSVDRRLKDMRLNRSKRLAAVTKETESMQDASNRESRALMECMARGHSKPFSHLRGINL